jgi:hypothetical protein
MNLADLSNLMRPRAGITHDRLTRIKREGSPAYVWNVPATAALASVSIYVPDQFLASRKYQPLDSMELVNNEASNDIQVTINGNDVRQVPAGSIRHIHGSGIALWHIQITNLGGAITTLGKIICTLQREPLTIDKWVQGGY